jgi:hypothetical protein
VILKHKNNEYHSKEEVDNIKDTVEYLEYEKLYKSSDQTWYFVMADCKGTLELYEDEFTKKEHLLGLSSFWEEIQ